jgi:glutamine---fructose-6-phosphate transaminase (isomerizing)
VVVIPRDDLYRKNVSTIEEIRARHGPVLAVTHAGEMPVVVDAAFDVPASEPELDPLLLNIPLQLLAYYVGVKKGCDIDKPRNLAKSVTVE